MSAASREKDGDDKGDGVKGLEKDLRSCRILLKSSGLGLSACGGDRGGRCGSGCGSRFFVSSAKAPLRRPWEEVPVFAKCTHKSRG